MDYLYIWADLCGVLAGLDRWTELDGAKWESDPDGGWEDMIPPAAFR